MMTSPEPSPIPSDGDGPVDRIWKRPPKKPVAAIFIHAGAGYHSIMNERVHLQACSDAASVGMEFLRAGATAPEAVEAAVRSLEDKEITNAGFGSNLNIDGVVECDATVVDHLGRSGACGAVPGVKNPITLAKRILDTSSKPLSLRRVPPNILVGQGAKEFAEEHGILTVRNESLISRNSRDRYFRWTEDLRRAEVKRNTRTTFPGSRPGPVRRTPTPEEYDKAAELASYGHNSQQRDHTSAILTGTWNEGQPDSPNSGGTLLAEGGSPAAPGTPPVVHKTTPSPNKSPDRASFTFMGTTFHARASKPTPAQPGELSGKSPGLVAGPLSPASANDGPAGGDDDMEDAADDFDYFETYGFDATHDQGSSKPSQTDRPGPQTSAKGMDLITDTVGAIAIDLQGNIAAGSSSGGIGMKHRGRIGPAALVGIGSAVVPEDPDDDLATSVAAVTSGTGEHMATTLASAKCAERLFQGTRRGPGGRDIQEEDEHVLLESFIVDDFMGHCGVKNQTSAGAIGVMTVKKDRTGIYFYFAHNTDSFALASMSSTEREPLCVMSRLGKTNQVAQGGRKVRVD